jgi:multidrug transporter EmrE-like cation transporter
VPAVAAYPTYSTCTIIVVGLAGVLFFKEKMSARQWVTVGMIIAALVMLNIA